jgi:flagellar biosynthesis protein FlhF
MKVKTFHALSMQDALRAIKEELGPDAIILSSKEVREGDRPLRVFDRPVLEVMAACEEPAPATASGRRDDDSAAGGRSMSAAEPPSSSAVTGFRATLESLLEPSGSPAQSPRAERRRARLRRLHDELCELSRRLGESLPPEMQSVREEPPTVLGGLCRSFVRQGMHPSSAETLGNDLRRRLGRDGADDEELMIQVLGQEIGRRIVVGGDLLDQTSGRVVRLILGPSGAGKTSIVTKLAARCRLERRRSVAVVTFDAYREVSVEQLRRYARALGVPFASARSPRQLRDGLRRHARADLVLVDMPGVRPDDVSSALELHRMLGEDADVATHVTLPACARAGELRGIIDRVGVLPSLHLVFTKLDETASFGTVYDVAQQTGLPLSYWGVGQRVPEDIEPASPERLAEFLIAQRYVAFRNPVRPTLSEARATHQLTSAGSVSHSNTWQEESLCGRT